MSDDPHEITSSDIAHMKVDSRGRLYWHGKEVITTTRLPWFVNVAVILAAAGTIGQFIIMLVDLVHKW